MPQIEIPYPENLLMNWPQLLSPAGFGDANYRFDDEHLFGQDWQAQNLPEYQILGSRAQTFPLRYRTKNTSYGLGGLMTNRLTHSQMVARIAELLARTVGQKVARRIKKTMGVGEFGEIRTHHFMSILKIAALVHDLGSPPFAHTGEYAVREWANEPWRQYMFRKRLTKGQLLDLQNFDANANALNILISKNVFTFPVMAAIAKYPNGSGDQPDQCYKPPKYGYLERDSGKFEIIADTMGMMKYSDRGERRYARHPLVYLLEAADDIAYLIHDFRDALKNDFYTLDMDTDFSNLTGKPEEILSARNLEQIFYYITGKYFNKSLSMHTKDNPQKVAMKLSQMEADMVETCVKAVTQAFFKYENEILDGMNMPGLIDLAILEDGSELGPIHQAIRKNFFTTVIDQIEIDRAHGKEIIKRILDIFCMSYFAFSTTTHYDSATVHGDATEELSAVKTFLSIISKYDNQGEARFSFDLSLNDFLQDVMRWLCQQSDNDIIRVGKELKDVPNLSQVMRSFQASFSNQQAPGAGP